MATQYPINIDSFSNPISVKADGADYVKAAHVNDLQDAIRAIQTSLMGSGISVSFNSNNYVPSDSSFKVAVDILDNSLKALSDDLDTHLELSMLTDSAQHHANVIEVSAGSGATLADISPLRVQTVLEVIRQEINLILDGQYVRGKTLADLYILKSGPALITGSLEVQDDVQFNGNTTLGQGASNTVTTSGDLFTGRNLEVAGSVTIGGSFELPAGFKVGQEGQLLYSSITFESDKTQINSMADIVLKLDSDALVNPLGETSKLSVLDAVNQEVFSVNEAGDSTIKESLTTKTVTALQEIILGTTDKISFTSENLSSSQADFALLLDNGEMAQKIADARSHGDLSENESFIISKNGYTGTDANNSDIILKSTKDELISGTTKLRPELTETGMFGLKFTSRNPGGEFQGDFVPYRQAKTAVVSPTITVDNTSINVGAVQTSMVSEYGFFIECDSITTGEVFLKGTYEA